MCLNVALDAGCNYNIKLFYTPNCLNPFDELCIKTLDATLEHYNYIFAYIV